MTQKEVNKSVKTHRSVLQLSPDSIHNNSLNTSTSKMQFSFSKTPRFSEDRHIIPSHFYQVGTTLSKRTTSLGYGQKMIETANKISPSPNLYTIKSDFDQKKGISIGLGRSDVKNVSLFPRQSSKQPSPLSYQPKFIQKTIKYSIGQKLNDVSNQWKMKIPGPGSYNQIDLTNEKCSNFVSKFVSAPTAKFPKLNRLGIQKNPESPGPAKYDTSNQIKTVSKFHSSKMYRFGNSKRKYVGQQSITPGPGSYNYFSQFLH